LKYMAEQPTYRILIGGGGTGGHVFPAIAIADAIRSLQPGCTFLFVGALGKLAMETVPEAGYTIQGLPVAGFQRKLTSRNVTFFFKLAASMVHSRRIINQFAPDLAIGVGGYASGPILKAAARKRVPILIQEQNSYAGMTNRLLARSAAAICVAYEHMDRYFPAEKIVLTGNPIREDLTGPMPDRLESLQAMGLSDDRKTFLVMGGSLGARSLNDSLLAGLAQLDRDGVQVLWQCGRFYHREVTAAVERTGSENIRVVDFISDMRQAYAVADVIVSRAGAITISELCVVGKPAILVPSPNVAEDHQTRNAEALVTAGAAVMVPDREAGGKLVDVMLELIFNTGRQIKLARNIKKLALPEASKRIAREALILAGRS